MASDLKVGIIGGTGLEKDNEIFVGMTEVSVQETPYGNASSNLVVTGTINSVPVVVLSRHGRNHDVSPSHVNYRANLWALKNQFGCNVILVTTACGSLREELAPGDLAVVDQYIDRTLGYRERSFYKVAHVPQGKPYNRTIQKVLVDSCNELKLTVHEQVTCISIEGPRFSTLAESKLYRTWGGHIVNMTAVPEAQLAAELGLPYAALALVTDYDCWHEDDSESVNVDLVTKRLIELGSKARSVLAHAIGKLAQMDVSQLIAHHQAIAKVAIMAK